MRSSAAEPDTLGVPVPQNLVAVSGPISFKLVRQRRKWDKKNRKFMGALPPALTRQDLNRKQSSFS
jgi:hypothetical protein